MSELLDLAVSLADRGRGDEQIEAFLSHDRTTEIKAYQGEVETLSSAEPRGAGVRIIEEGRAGFAYTTDLSPSGLDEVVALARQNTASATPDDAVGIGPAWTKTPADVDGLVDETHGTVTPETKADLAVTLETTTRKLDPRVRTVEEAGYADSDTTIAIATSTGIAGSYRRTDAWCYVLAIATDGEDTEIGFDFDLATGFSGLDADSVASRAAERAVSMLGATKIESGRLPVVLDPYTSAQFLGVLGRAITGDAIQKGRSLFAGRLGERVADEAVTLIDDGRVPGAPGSSPWDAEGTPSRRTSVIADGVLTSFLYDLKSARREGRASTGNASRAGYRSAPGPAPTNLAFASTGSTRSDILKQAGRALLVHDFHGVHSGANPVTGDFSVGVSGRLIENGVPTQAVKEVTIAAPMLEILAGIKAVADDRRWLPFGGSLGGATTLIAEMTVAGR
ncbi:MAG TPA: TldD/PmbA family protein [Actinomycetota bacterium]|nr:TldD/PmbA family protein [Actinomycetota bacterium]